MASKKPERSLTDDSSKLNAVQFWQSSFIAATWPILLAHDGKQLTPAGAAHLCADFADAAVRELNQRHSK